MSEGVAVVQQQAIARQSLKRQRLFLILSTVAFSLWVAAMLAMYFTTVYPQRHQTEQVQTVR